jgi:hypothetical protein
LAASKGVYDGGLIDKSSTSRINKVTLIPFRITSSALNTPELTSLSAQMLAPDTLESVPVLSDACFVITVKGDAIDLKSSERGKLSACPKCRGGGVMLRHVEEFSYGRPKTTQSVAEWSESCNPHTRQALGWQSVWDCGQLASFPVRN